MAPHPKPTPKLATEQLATCNGAAGSAKAPAEARPSASRPATTVSRSTAQPTASAAARLESAAEAAQSPTEVSVVLGGEEVEVVLGGEEAPTTDVSFSLDGEVSLRYSMYNERFPITGGQTTAKAIDEVYALTDIMPGCCIHLSSLSPEEKYRADADRLPVPYMFENPAGHFHGLQADGVYFVYVEEDDAEFLKSQELTRKHFGGFKEEQSGGTDERYGAYASAFKQVLMQAKTDGYTKGLDGADLSAFVQQQIQEFNRGQ
ncbi:unnamed protein product [Polarella glacialis]|uniref:Uncharacterized protein n=1 Tax=Polarella glacialis TaxID=89957 RepID=A0A813LJX8_POLGL|nr:unnamed protein product [Polarella glacialis]CAE8731039.1 unnamed protein product [Polarella glacialis]